ncbi:hypothetical protein C1646_750520 [Rhizophagus diaphanus]|nr:hypothetical protein C1646_750520 [Rhizophagus diaphanus] [Rhizophagus sp. MUCL 43196]
MLVAFGLELVYEAKQQGFQIIKDRVSRDNSNSEQLIKLLQEFTEVGKSDSEELNEINQEDEISDKLILTLWYQCREIRKSGTKYLTLVWNNYWLELGDIN